MANTVLHKADSRGHADHGWLNAHHSFSFANYHNPDRVHFGVLRVLNDDVIAGGMGFGTHPHDNMEIISIPLEGELEHKDSMGNGAVIRHNEVQAMSAGTGIRHSEKNPNHGQPTNLLQIWIFPKSRNIAPRYDQRLFDPKGRVNQWQQIVSPIGDEEGIHIHQDAWFQLGDFDKGVETTYPIKKKDNGVYAFVIKGHATINGQALSQRDGLGIWDVEELTVKADSDSEILLMDVPMIL